MHYHNLVCLKVLENILFCKHGRDCWASDLCNFHTADYMKIGSACCSACWLLPLVPLREDHTQRRQINSACLACSYGNCFFFCTFVPQRNGIGQTFISKVGTAKYLDPGVAGKLKAEAEGKYHFISIVFTGTILCTTKNVFFCYWNCDLLKHLLRLALPAFLTRPLLLCSFFLCVILLSISTTNKTKVLLCVWPVTRKTKGGNYKFFCHG